MKLSILDPFDFTSLTTSVTFSAISPLRCVDINITEDQVVEGTEDFTITLATGDTAVNLTTASANIIIEDTSGSNTIISAKIHKLWVAHFMDSSVIGHDDSQ